MLRTARLIDDEICDVLSREVSLPASPPTFGTIKKKNRTCFAAEEPNFFANRTLRSLLLYKAICEAAPLLRVGGSGCPSVTLESQK